MYNVITNQNLPVKKAIRKIAFMNINKRGGKNKCNMSKLKQYAQDYSEFIRRQIEIINPKVIVCCGNKVDNMIANVLGFDEHVSTNISTQYCHNVKFYKKDDILIIPMLHPTIGGHKKYSELRKGSKEERIDKYVHEFKNRFDAIKSFINAKNKTRQ